MDPIYGDTHSFKNNFTDRNSRLFDADEIASLNELHHVDPPVLAQREWRTEALSLIHRVSRDVIDATLVAPLLKDIASIITSSFPITFAAIETYDGDHVEFSATSMTQDVTQSASVSLVAPLSHTLAGEVMRRKTTLILSDAHKHDYLVCPSLPQPLHVYHYIGVPLKVDGIVTGVLSIATSHHIVVDKETITWSETIAHHISALLTRDAVSSQLKSQENIAAHMLNALSSPTMMCEKDGTIVHVNAAFRSIVEVFHGRTMDEHSSNIFQLFDTPTKSNSYIHELREHITDLFDGHSQHTRIDILLTRAGFHRWYLATMSLMPDQQTAIVMFVDISDRKQAEEKLEHEMLHDQSTGLANRILFHDRVNTTHAHNVAHGKYTCVIALDVGRHAFIVESLGYDAADRILLKVAHRIESILHATDLIARVGSSEFALLLENINDVDQARQFSLSIINLFRTPFEIDGQEVVLSPTIGITVAESDSQLDADMIMHDAHAAMTNARDNLASQYAFANVASSSEAFQKLNKERELHQAITQGELKVFYQPEIELHTGRIVGVEALVRWMHPEQGMITPDSFVSLAEESGLIDALFEKVFTQVVLNAQTLFAHGFNFTLWTNLSAKQFTIDSATQLISHHVSNADVPPYMFGIEITETAVMENSESACTTLQQLKDVGIQLALDDFGTGYSSLAYLQSFPVDIVKIDQTFISELGKTKASTEIVSAVIGLAHGLHLQALAEGIESQQNLKILRELGCDLGQGYLFAHPLPFDTLVDFLHNS